MTEGSVSGGVMRREVNASLEARIAERAQERSTTWLLSPDLLGALNSEGHFTTSNPPGSRCSAGPKPKSPRCRSSNCFILTKSSKCAIVDLRQAGL